MSRFSSMNRPGWQPASAYAFPGFQDLVEDARPLLTKAKFRAVVKSYLKEQGFRRPLPPTILTSLFKRTLNCLKQIEALPKMRLLVRGADWKNAQKILRRLT